MITSILFCIFTSEFGEVLVHGGLKNIVLFCFVLLVLKKLKCSPG